MDKKVDARGLSCPQPVILTRETIRDLTGGRVLVVLDDMTSVNNVTRVAKKLGWHVSFEKEKAEYHLLLEK